MGEVGHAFGDEAVGGSSHCQKRIQQAFREVEYLGQQPNGRGNIRLL